MVLLSSSSSFFHWNSILVLIFVLNPVQHCHHGYGNGSGSCCSTVGIVEGFVILPSSSRTHPNKNEFTTTTTTTAPAQLQQQQQQQRIKRPREKNRPFVTVSRLLAAANNNADDNKNDSNQSRDKHSSNGKRTSSNGGNANVNGGGGGYKFGDITKSIFGTTVQKITGKTTEDYQFGDMTKSVVTKVTGKDTYQFGDITKALDLKAKQRVANFTGKADISDYQLGDITQEVLRRVQTGEYKWDDVWLMMKILVTVGAEFTPFTSALPIKILLQMMNYALAEEVSGKVLEVVATALDKRFKETFTGNANYQLGDLTKQTLLNFIDKEQYEFGDISRTVSKMNSKGTKKQFSTTTSHDAPRLLEETRLPPIDAELVAELEAWDQTRNVTAISKFSQN